MGGGGREATWYQPYPDVCVENRRILVSFWLQVNEMSENMSFKMGVEFVVPLYLGSVLFK